MRYIDCPYCDEILEEEDFDYFFEELYDGDEIELSCPKCNKTFAVLVEYEITYNSYKLDFEN